LKRLSCRNEDAVGQKQQGPRLLVMMLADVVLMCFELFLGNRKQDEQFDGRSFTVTFLSARSSRSGVLFFGGSCEVCSV